MQGYRNAGVPTRHQVMLYLQEGLLESGQEDVRQVGMCWTVTGPRYVVWC
jgi:hypothetical protein